LREHGYVVLEGLPRLTGDIARLKAALPVPANLACHEDQLAISENTVRVTAWTGPAWRLEDLHVRVPIERS
jgi:hypothetical protein